MERNYLYCAGLLFPFKARRRAHSLVYAIEAATRKGDNRTSKTGNFFSENRLNPTRAFRICAILFLVLALPSWVQADACPEEKRRAATVRKRIEREWPLRETDPVVQYIHGFGRRLADRAGIRRTASWRFEVVRDYSVNAFAIGDGHIYLTEGAILVAADEAELAAILAHEMGHQVAGHFCIGPTPIDGRKSWWEILLSPAEHPPPEVSARRDANFGSLRRGIDPAKEREADRLTADILRAAGYDPMAGTTRVRRMARSPATGVDSGHLTPLVRPAPTPRSDRDRQPHRPQQSSELRRIQGLLKKEH